MRLSLLRVDQFRAFQAAEIRPAPGCNFLLGGNGSGKTSLLEAAYLLAYGRSFRGGAHEALIRHGASRFQVFSEWHDGARERRLGLAREARNWTARVDGAPAETLAALHAACAVVCFEPGSHALLEGGGELRRRFLDWGLFHVEQDFLPTWRRYQRALRQRNALLKQAPAAGLLAPWDREIVAEGERLDALRQGYLARLQPQAARIAAHLLPELGDLELQHVRGWPAGLGLAEALVQGEGRDLRLGFTGVGPHRGDFRVRYRALQGIDVLSRGQEKLTALALLLAQAEDLASRRGDWPVLLLDDLGSELDRPHQALVWSWLAERPVQALVTGTEPPAAALRAPIEAMFHVERGAADGSRVEGAPPG